MTAIISLATVIAIIWLVAGAIYFCNTISEYDLPVLTKRMFIFSAVCGPIAWIIQLFRMLMELLAELPSIGETATWANGGKKPESTRSYWY